MSNAGKEPGQKGPHDQSPDTELFEAYRQMLTYLFMSTLGVIALITVPVIAIEVLNQDSPGVDDHDFPVFALVPLAGALGAFFSALMRLYSVRELPAALLHSQLSRLRNRYLLMYSLIPPVVGMIGAAVLYVTIASQLIDGEMFPSFRCKIDDCNSFVGLLSYGPDAVHDYAKVLVWSFVAGFSERLVPDSLQGLSSGDH